MPADDGIEKSAILLIALGEDYASEVLKHLGPKEVQKLGHAMASMKTVPRAKVEEVLADFPLPELGIYAMLPGNRQVPHRVRVLIDFLAERLA